MMKKKAILLGLAGFGAWWFWRNYENYATENYILTGEEGSFDKVGGFIKTSFDSAISYGQEELGMNFSVQLLDYLKMWEGFEPRPKPDQAGNLTIGYGHKLINGDGFDSNSVLTEIEATGLLLNDIQSKAQKWVSLYINIPLSQNQFDALVSFTFNGGEIRRLATSVNAGKSDVVSRMKTWNKITDKKTGKLVVSKGLVNRRAADARIWESGVYSR